MEKAEVGLVGKEPCHNGFLNRIEQNLVDLPHLDHAANSSEQVWHNNVDGKKRELMS